MPVKFTNNSAQILAKLNGAIRDSLQETGRETVENIRELAPKKSGDLSESYVDEIDGNKLTIGTDSPYAIPAEYGTQDRAAKPHFRPAVENILEDVAIKIKGKMR